jgi:hypothetical protein
MRWQTHWGGAGVARGGGGRGGAHGQAAEVADAKSSLQTQLRWRPTADLGSRRDPSRCGLWPYGGAVGGSRGADLRNSVKIHPATGRGGTATGENRALTPVMADDGGVFTLLPC